MVEETSAGFRPMSDHNHLSVNINLIVNKLYNKNVKCFLCILVCLANKKYCIIFTSN